MIYKHQFMVECYKECFGKMADRQGILWLKSSKRKASKDKMQGKGWEMVESKRTHEENIDIFKTVKKLFDLENPRHSPYLLNSKLQLSETCDIYNKHVFMISLVDLLKEN
jgi:hypothetical protein